MPGSRRSSRASAARTPFGNRTEATPYDQSSRNATGRPAPADGPRARRTSPAPCAGARCAAGIARQVAAVGDEELDVLVDEPLQQQLPVAHLDAQVDAGMVAAQLGQQRRQECRRRKGADAERRVAERAVAIEHRRRASGSGCRTPAGARARATNSPAGVGVTASEPRSNRRMPSSASAAWMLRVSAGWVRFTCSAARAKLRLSASATRCASRLKSMARALGGNANSASILGAQCIGLPAARALRLRAARRRPARALKRGRRR